METLLITIFLTIIFSAFFSGMEIAFVSANRLRLELDKKKESFTSRILTIFTKNPGQYIATMLMGNNIALVIYGVAFAELMEPFFMKMVSSDGAVLFLQTVSSTLIILFTAEFLPKTLFRLKPNIFLKIFAVPLIIFYYFFYPLTKFTMAISKMLLNGIFRASIDKDEEQTVFSRIDLDHFVNEKDQPDHQQAAHELDNEIKLFRNALDFSKIKIREIMVPRTEIEALEMGSSLEDLRQKFIDTGYSRILFYKENIDNVLGYVHHSTIFNNPESIGQNMQKLIIVPEAMQASKLLSKFIQQHRSMAIVVDEFGGTSGLVTIEDILEEIFGEIEDEHDTVDLVDRQLNDNEFIFSARIELDFVNEKYNLNLPVAENYETIAGFILFHHESIPKINTVITIDHFRFQVLKASHTRIELVKLHILENS